MSCYLHDSSARFAKIATLFEGLPNGPDEEDDDDKSTITLSETMTQGSVVGDQDGRRDLSTSKDEQVSKDSGNLKNELPFVKDRLRAWDLVFADMNADR